MQSPVRVGGRKVGAFWEDGAPQAPERDFALPHLYLSISFPSVSPPFSPLSILFFPHSLPSESCNQRRSLLTVHGGTWKQQVNPFSPRADTPIHQFVSVSLREKSS